MPKTSKADYTHVGVLEGNSSVDRHIHKEKEKTEVKNICPECGNQVYFLEAGFLCPTCGYSVETVFS